MQEKSLYLSESIADTQLKDLLPAIGRLYHNAALIYYKEMII